MKTIYAASCLFLVVFLSGCSATQRLNRLLDEHPELVVVDTLVVTDTILTTRVETDTLLPLAQLTEPMIIQKGPLEVIVQTLRDTLWVQGKCKADTIYRTRRIPVEKIRIVKPDHLDALIPRIPWLSAALITLVCGVIFMIAKLKPRTP